jgi:UDPglucose--hexose-1-phosphate uridylyltransferase
MTMSQQSEPVTLNGPELRKNIITREWVIISPGRRGRPSDFSQPSPTPVSISADPAGNCPFCPGHESNTPNPLLEIPDDKQSSWKVRVVPNKFAALRCDQELSRVEVGAYDILGGHGTHEVIIESPEHHLDLWQMDLPQIEAVLLAYRDRIIELQRDPRLKYALIFRNHGERAGTSLLHPHSQLIASPVVPLKILLELEGVARFQEYEEMCPYCEIIRQESGNQMRTVIETDEFISFTSFAGRYPFETWILPKHHLSNYAHAHRHDLKAFAGILRETLERLCTAIPNLSYNYALHTSPLGEQDPLSFHWHLEIFPRITTLGGFELGSELYINSVVPEEAARILREAL